METPRDEVSLWWSKKAKRSKRLSPPPPPPPEYDADEISAAESLILLANCGGGFCPAEISIIPSSSTGSRNDEQKSTARDLTVFDSKKHHQSSCSAVFDAKNRQESSCCVDPATTAAVTNSTLLDLPIFDPKKHDQSSCSATHLPIVDAKNCQEPSYSGGPATTSAATNPTPATFGSKKRKEASPDTPLLLAYKNSHECYMCGKTFPTHQALGGHMTSHRVRLRVTTAPDGTTTATAATATNRISALNPSCRLHECSDCHEVFPTGQALGGHKRKHYEGRLARVAAVNCNTTSFNHIAGGDGGRSSNGGATGLNIDLNLPPPLELC